MRLICSFDGTHRLCSVTLWLKLNLHIASIPSLIAVEPAAPGRTTEEVALMFKIFFSYGRLVCGVTFGGDIRFFRVGRLTDTIQISAMAIRQLASKATNYGVRFPDYSAPPPPLRNHSGHGDLLYSVLTSPSSTAGVSFIGLQFAYAQLLDTKT